MFTIGEFSKLCRVSARMLRHYDAIGLLRPAHVDPANGYRYYDPAQLPVLQQIETLKSYGFPLSQIAGLLSLPPNQLSRRIHVRRLEAHEELHALRKLLRRMENDILRMEDHPMELDKYSVIVMPTPPQKVFSVRKTIAVSETHELFEELYQQMKERGLTRGGVTQLVFLGEEFSYESMDVEAQVQVMGEGAGVKEIPAQLCVATTHVGPYQTVRYAYEAIRAYLAEHPEYQVCGPGVERYLKDENQASTPEELETGILFPVKKLESAT